MVAADADNSPRVFVEHISKVGKGFVIAAP